MDNWKSREGEWKVTLHKRGYVISKRERAFLICWVHPGVPLAQNGCQAHSKCFMNICHVNQWTDKNPSPTHFSGVYPIFCFDFSSSRTMIKPCSHSPPFSLPQTIIGNLYGSIKTAPMTRLQSSQLGMPFLWATGQNCFQKSKLMLQKEQNM